MEQSPRYLGLDELVDTVSRLLNRLPVGAGEDRKELASRITDGIKTLLQEHLGPGGIPFDVWQGKEGGAQPAHFFGADFYPDVAVDVAEQPTLALVLGCPGGRRGHQRELATALGQALVCSQQYPAVVLCIIGKRTKGKDYQQLLARELQMSLWSQHRIRIVLRHL